MAVTGYSLMRNWFDFALENQEKITGNHTAMFAWFIEKNNRFKWAKSFGVPRDETMAACGIRSYNTYKKVFDDLVSWNFVNLIEESKNQYSACVIALSNFDKAFDKANESHLTKQVNSIDTGTVAIIKQVNNKTLKNSRRKVFIAPTLEMVIEYFKENFYTKEAAQKAFSYYDIANWHDSKNNKVKNWKQKMQSVWFKPENLIKQNINSSQIKMVY